MTTRASIGRTAAVILAGIACAAPLAACSGPQPRQNEARLPPERRTREALEKLREAERAERRGKSQEALALYREAIELDSRLPVAWNDIGTLLVEQENYLDAVRAFRVAADLDPTDPRPMYNIGTAYSRAGWAEEALDAYELALEREPNDLPSLRGAVRSAGLLAIADRRTLDRIRLALLIEQDDRWRTFFERERFRVEGAIREGRSREVQASRGVLTN